MFFGMVRLQEAPVEVVHQVGSAPVQMGFDGGAVSNLFLWLAVPSTYSFSHWFRTAFDQGAFEQLFEVYDTQDGYDIYVTRWQTEATVQMTIQ